MARRLALLSALLAVVTGTASAATGDWRQRQSEIEDRITALRTKIRWAGSRETVLTSEISLVTARIRAFERDVRRTTDRLEAIEIDLAVRRNRLAALTLTYKLQTAQLNRLKREYVAAETTAYRRVVAVYQEDEPTAADVILAARNFADLLDRLDYLEEISRQDQSIALQLSTAKKRTAAARRRTNEARRQVAEAAKALEAQLQEQLAQRERLLSAQAQLADARSLKQRTLSRVRLSKHEFLHEVDGLQRKSRELAAKIRASQARAAQGSGGAPASVGGVSASGFLWPVSGPVTSGFGWRWGRMHEGIDIAAPTGAPIVASAGGTVIYSGWMSGYGNLVVVDHGGGLATAYAHMSSIAASNGQAVGRGQVLGYVGCTGHCFGSHLHFEVRVNGQPVDPLGYL